MNLKSTNNKKNLLLYTDCTFFAGCENVISNLLNDDEFTNTFNLYYAYNYSKKYQEGLELKIHKNDFTIIKLKLLDQIVYDRFNIVVKLLLIAPSILYKYFSIIINTIILTYKFKKQKCDILLLNNGGYPGSYSSYATFFAAKLNNINNIFYIVNNQAQDYKHPSRWLDFLLDKLVIKGVNKFITGSDNSGKRLKEVLRTSDDKMVTINNGVLLPSIKETPFEIKQKYNLPSNKIIALVGANLVKRKGHIYLLEAILQLKMELNQNLPIHFVFAGDGEERNNLIDYIILNDLGNYVTMLGHINDIFTLINAADILILPSISHEDFPYIIIEAMSLSKPVIGTKVAGIPEQIINNINGYLIEPSDASAIKEALLKFIYNPILIENFGAESKKIFNQKFQIKIGVHKYINLLKFNKNYFS
jgi:glycosyltransferase involved in cell wall biosynthesis